MRRKHDLIAIGDCTIDAFIKLHQASVHCDLRHEKCQLCMSFADKIPYESLDVIPAVGNSSNVAVGIARLGLRSAILTAIGDDYYGKQILEVYRHEGVSQKFIKINTGVGTNYHLVLSFQAERTILIKHNDYAYHRPGVIDDAPWIYFSSMGEHTLPFHLELGRHLRAHPRVRMGFNPGTFQLQLGAEKLKDVYRHTYALFVNREEAARILKTKSSNIKTLFAGLHGLGPKIVAITDGPKGAYASDGREAYFIPLYPDPAPPFERTGSGDAFSSGFTAALVYGLPLEDALRWGPVNSMNVVRYTGAQKGLLTKPQLLALLRKAPKNYKPRTI